VASRTAPPYQRRVVDDELDELLPSLPAIALDGPKAVGKTATARRRVREVLALDDPAQLRILAADPSRLAELPRPLLLDEWQRFPPSWDIVRRAVDHGASAGDFLITGSAASDAPVHSGAGRIVRLRMRPMSLTERGISSARVSLRALLDGRRPRLGGRTRVGLEDYVDEVLASGFPAIRRARGRARTLQLDAYIDRIVDRDFPEQGRAVRRPHVLRRWLAAYAAATATSTSLEKVRDAATAGEAEKPSRATVLDYREILERLWILDPIPAWQPSRNRLGVLRVAPTMHLADPAIGARLLGVDAPALLGGVRAEDALGTEVSIGGDRPLLGQLFESLVALDVRVYAQAVDARVGHLRAKSGAREVDLIVSRADERVLAIEVKLTADPSDDDAEHLNWLQEQMGDRLLDAVIVTTGREAYRRPDGVGVVPAALLGP
jgi:hypothetical protein